MIASNVALVTLAFSPISLASALARSASIPSIVLPSPPMDSIGGELGADATIRVPLLLYLAGTLPATAGLAVPGDAAVELVALDVDLLLLSLLEPHPGSATRQSARVALVRTARGVALRISAPPPRWVFLCGNPTRYASLGVRRAAITRAGCARRARRPAGRSRGRSRAPRTRRSPGTR